VFVSASIRVADGKRPNAHVSLQALTEHRRDIPAFGVESAETLGPADKFSVIDALLPIEPQGVTYCLGRSPTLVRTRLTSMGTRTRRDVLRLDSQHDLK
jgi:hypothetical protein